MRSLKPKTKFYLFAFGVPLLLIILWAAKDGMVVMTNYLEIWTLQHSIQKLATQKQSINADIEKLRTNDPQAWEKVLRNEIHALKPNEVEYRFKH